jgi:hypothetical protein
VQQGRVIISSILTQENEQKLTITVTSHGIFKRRCRSVHNGKIQIITSYSMHTMITFQTVTTATFKWVLEFFSIINPVLKGNGNIFFYFLV